MLKLTCGTFIARLYVQRRPIWLFLEVNHYIQEIYQKLENLRPKFNGDLVISLSVLYSIRKSSLLGPIPFSPPIIDSSLVHYLSIDRAASKFLYLLKMRGIMLNGSNLFSFGPLILSNIVSLQVLFLFGPLGDPASSISTAMP